MTPLTDEMLNEWGFGLERNIALNKIMGRETEKLEDILNLLTEVRRLRAVEKEMKELGNTFNAEEGGTLCFGYFWKNKKNICVQWDERTEECRHIATWFHGVRLGVAIAKVEADKIAFAKHFPTEGSLNDEA